MPIDISVGGFLLSLREMSVSHKGPKFKATNPGMIQSATRTYLCAKKGGKRSECNFFRKIAFGGEREKRGLRRLLPSAINLYIYSEV